MEKFFDEIFSRKEALKGVRVLDITRVILGPWCATLLAELGAEVIHVEVPGTGDVLIRPVAPWGDFPRGISPGMMCANANKYFFGLDMRKEEGQEIVKELVARTDILIENFKGGTFEKWGIGYRQLREINPSLIYISMQGFGNWGPLSERPSYDAYAQGITGLAEITGFEESMATKSSAWIGDFLSGTYGAFVAMVALFYRKRTGKGQFIDISQAELLIRSMDWTWLYQKVAGKRRSRFGNRDMAVVPSCIVRTKDGFAALGAWTEREFNGLISVMGREDLSEFAPLEKRHQGAEKIYSAVEEWAKGVSTADLLEAAERGGFAAARVMNSKDIHESPHFNERRAVWKFDDPVWGDLAYPFALHLEETPGRIRWSMRPVGFDNEYVLRKVLGLSQEKVAELYEKGVVGKWDEKVPFACPPPGWDGEAGLTFKE
ncbi:MAG: CoA transferase [Deltaproteobacteria bacterium]|nr:MAG: CoA transferase [Deltaproteobacteria bacterium]